MFLHTVGDQVMLLRQVYEDSELGALYQGTTGSALEHMPRWSSWEPCLGGMISGDPRSQGLVLHAWLPTETMGLPQALQSFANPAASSLNSRLRCF